MCGTLSELAVDQERPVTLEDELMSGSKIYIRGTLFQEEGGFTIGRPGISPVSSRIALGMIKSIDVENRVIFMTPRNLIT